MRRLLIVGAGGHGRSVAEAVMAGGEFQLAGFVDDAAQSLSQVWGLPVFGTTLDLVGQRMHADVAIVAIGNNHLREILHKRLAEAGFELVSIIHPKAIVSPTAIIGVGSAIMAGSVVGTEAQLGQGVIVNCGAVVDHHCCVDDFGHLGVNACMAGGSALGSRGWMQAGAALGYRVKIEPDTVLGVGESIENI